MSAAADNGFAAAVQSLTEGLRAACNDPSDAIRLLSGLASYAPASLPSTAPIGAAVALLAASMGQLFRRAALTSLARACGQYQPTSYDDALSLRLAVVALFDAEIEVAADAGQDASYGAFRGLRASVAADLIARGSDLARLAVVTTRIPTPSLTLAYRLYRDASRADDLAARSDAVAPAFLPLSFKALSS